MKTKISPLLFFFIFLLISNFINTSKAAEIPAIVRDWAAYAGHTDSAFKAPVASDTNFTYVASFTINSGTGADILLVKYDKDGIKQWEKVWTGPGAGRDQATGIVLTNDDIYICGFSYTSGVNDYDMVTLKYKKDGSFVWASTFNGPGSSYDGAAAIALNASGLYVAGVINNTTSSSLDYGLIRYDMSSGAQLWQVSYDYNQLMDIPFALTVSNDSIITITGGSQSSLYDWDYATLNYGPTDTLLSTNRVSGSSAGFDRAQAVKSDANGNVYITGSSAQNSTGYDVKTVKILANGTLDWMKTQDGDGADDEGTDLIVDANGNVYVCGTIGFNGQKDIMVLKYDKHGVQQWSQYIDYSTGDDFGVKMCFDQYGNIIVTGSVKTNVYDIYTAGFKPEDGAKVWEDVYDAPYHGLDKAFDITCDANGYIYVTGTAEADTGFGTVTLKYRTDYYTEPGQIDTPAVSYLFYPNSGQIIDTDGKTSNGVDYYTQHYYPQLYFREGEMNMVWAHIDQDTATADTMQRVDVSFLGSSNPTKAFPLKEREDAGYLNYFLGHCPNGITQVYGNESLLFEGVYSGIDAIYSSNNAGLKLYFVCAAQSDPSNIGLKFEGQDNVQIVNNWELQVQTLLGTYEFEKPRVYQLDGSGNRITLPWTLSWTMNASDEAKFTGWGNYDRDKMLVIEIGKTSTSLLLGCSQSLCWSTFFGSVLDEKTMDITTDQNGDMYQTGETFSSSLPFSNRGIQTNNSNQIKTDAFIVKYLNTGISGNPNSNVRWTTFYGGKNNESGMGIALNSLGDIYIVGVTESNTVSFIVQNSQYTGIYTPYNQLLLNQDDRNGMDAFILRMNNDCTQRQWVTYFGGEAFESGYDIAINGDDDVYIVGESRTDNSSATLDFPIVPSQNSSGQPYNQSHFGGIHFGDSNQPVFHGDGFISRFNTHDELIWSSYFGTVAEDRLTNICILSNSLVAITGSSSCNSSNTTSLTSPPCPSNSTGQFPLCGSSSGNVFTNRGGMDATVEVFNLQDELVYSSFFGSSAIDGDWEQGNGGILSNTNVGTTYPRISTRIPEFTSSDICLVGTCGDPGSGAKIPLINPNSSNSSVYFQDQFGGGASDLFILYLTNTSSSSTPAFTPVYASYFGGGGSTGAGDELGGGVALDDNGDIYFSGLTMSDNPSSLYCNENGSQEFPLCKGPGNSTFDYFNYTPGPLSDAFIARINSNFELTWSTFIGGSGLGGFPVEECINSLSIVKDKYIYFGGYSNVDVLPNTSFPVIDDGINHMYVSHLIHATDAVVGRFEFDLTIGLDELHNDDSFSIYPNPANQIVTVEFQNIPQLFRNLKIYNALGEIMNLNYKQVNNHLNQITIDVSSLSKGIYIVSDGPFNSKLVIQ